MMFSTKAEYGVRVMVELARRAGEDPIPLAEIAEHDGLPLAYLEHLVARLRKAGLVDSRRGSRGGYLLARSPTEITMAEVVQALEGSIAPIECISQGPTARSSARGSPIRRMCVRRSCCGRACALRSCARCRKRRSPTSYSRQRSRMGRCCRAPGSTRKRKHSRLEPEKRTWPT